MGNQRFSYYLIHPVSVPWKHLYWQPEALSTIE